MAETQDSVELALAQAIAPLEEQRDLVEADIAELEQRLRERRKQRTRLNQVIGALDPSKRAGAKPGPKRESRDRKGPQVSQEKIEVTLAWLRENRNGDDFYATGLPWDQIGVGGMSEASGSAALRELERRGLVRLDHLEKGNRRHLRLTRAPSDA